MNFFKICTVNNALCTYIPLFFFDNVSRKFIYSYFYIVHFYKCYKVLIIFKTVR